MCSIHGLLRLEDPCLAFFLFFFSVIRFLTRSLKNTVNINVKDVVRRIFQFKPSRRMFLEELRAHPFIDLPPEEISTVDATVDDELVDALCAQQGLDRDFVLSSLQPHDGKLPCNGVYTSYQMLLMKKMTKKNEVSEL